MKIKNFLLGIIGIFSIFLVTAWAVAPTETVCHNGKTLTVQKSAVAAHLAHGDTLGECD